MIKIKKEWERAPWRLIKNDIGVKYFPNRINKRLEELKKKCKQRVNNHSLFSHVAIETISACNNDCSFCPVSIINNKRPLVYMNDSLFKEIIRQLKELNFMGSLLLDINNEPLLDKRLSQRITHIRQILGDDVKISIETNGILLTASKIHRLFESGLNNIYIDDYADCWYDYLLFTKRTRKNLQELDTKKINKNVILTINHRFKKQVLSDRSGKTKGRKFIGIADRNKFCDFPFSSMNINAKGNVIICCRDSYWQEVMGNIENNNLEEIWFSDKYKKVREDFLRDERILSLCQECSSNGSLTI